MHVASHHGPVRPRCLDVCAADVVSKLCSGRFQVGMSCKMACCGREEAMGSYKDSRPMRQHLVGRFWSWLAVDWQAVLRQERAGAESACDAYGSCAAKLPQEASVKLIDSYLRWPAVCRNGQQ